MSLKRILPLLLLPLLLLPMLLAQAASPPPPATRSAMSEPSSAFLSRYIDDQTLLVAHLDASAIDTGALETFVTHIFDNMKMPADDATRAGIPVVRTAANVFLARFKQLGGRHVFIVLNQSDLYPEMSGPAVIVKIEPGGDAKGILALINATLGEDKGIATLMRDDALILAESSSVPAQATIPSPTLKRIENIKPQPRPDLAFIATEDSHEALEVVAAFTPDQRRVIHDFLPTLPTELGGGSTDLLTQDVENISLHLRLPPAPAAGIKFTLRPGASSLPLSQLITRTRGTILADKDFNRSLDTIPELKPMAADIRALVRDVLTPEPSVSNIPATARESLVLRITDKQVERLTLLLAPALDRSRTVAARARSAANMHAILQAVMVYAAEHGDALPPTLNDVLQMKNPDFKLDPALLNSPDDPKHRPYIYRPWVAKLSAIKNPSEIPLTWEQADEPNDGRNVGFADGHVEWMRSQAFDKLLADTEVWAKTVKPAP